MFVARSSCKCRSMSSWTMILSHLKLSNWFSGQNVKTKCNRSYRRGFTRPGRTNIIVLISNQMSLSLDAGFGQNSIGRRALNLSVQDMRSWTKQCSVWMCGDPDLDVIQTTRLGYIQCIYRAESVIKHIAYVQCSRDAMQCFFLRPLTTCMLTRYMYAQITLLYARPTCMYWILDFTCKRIF